MYDRSVQPYGPVLKLNQRGVIITNTDLQDIIYHPTYRNKDDSQVSWSDEVPSRSGPRCVGRPTGGFPPPPLPSPLSVTKTPDQ